LSVPAAGRAATAVVGVDAAEVRSAPHEVAPKVGTLTRGQKVSVSDAAKNGWRFVQLEGGRAGYVHDDALGDLEVIVTASLPATPAPPGAAGPPAVAATAGPPGPAAPVLPPRLAKPFILRPELNVTYNGDLELFTPVADASSLGLTLGRNVVERVSLEAMLGFNPGQGRSVTTGQGVTMTDTVPVAVTLMAAARVAPLLSTGGRHALTVAGGAYSLLSGGWGPTTFAHAEAAYEYRGHYVTFLVGYGANVTLNDSDRQTVGCGIFQGTTCEVGFRRGDVLGHFRLGVGMTF
jgi:hypothetical protein